LKKIQKTETKTSGAQATFYSQTRRWFPRFYILWGAFRFSLSISLSKKSTRRIRVLLCLKQIFFQINLNLHGKFQQLVPILVLYRS